MQRDVDFAPLLARGEHDALDQPSDGVRGFGTGDAIPVVGDSDGLEPLQIIFNQRHVDLRGVRIDSVPDQFGQGEDGFSGLRDPLQMVVLNLYL